MTDIRVQKIEIKDCENQWIAHEYYYWGGGTHRDRAREQTTVWEEILDKHGREEVMRLVQLGHRTFDGYRVPQDDDFTLADVFVTKAIYSHVVNRDAENFVKYGRELLAELPPPDVSLLDATDNDIRQAGEAIEDFVKKSTGISWSKASKVTYKKRPLFIPPIDDHVYWTLTSNFPHLFVKTDNSFSEFARYLYVIREICKVLKRDLIAINRNLRKDWGISLPLVRIVSFLFYQWYKAATGEDKREDIANDCNLWTHKGIAKFWRTGSIEAAKNDANKKAQEMGFPTRATMSEFVSGCSEGNP